MEAQRAALDYARLCAGSRAVNLEQARALTLQNLARLVGCKGELNAEKDMA
jgi:hypothetical protein